MRGRFVMTTGANTLKITPLIRIAAALQRHPMVHNGCRRDSPGSLAWFAKWILLQLLHSQLAPPCRLIERLLAGISARQFVGTITCAFVLVAVASGIVGQFWTSELPASGF